MWPKITLNTFRFFVLLFTSLTPPPYHMVAVFFMPSKKYYIFIKT